MPHKKICIPLRPCCVPSKTGNSNAPKNTTHGTCPPHHNTHPPTKRKNFNLCNNTSKISHTPLFKAKWTPARSTIISSNKYIKRTYLMDFPPCSNLKHPIKLSKL